MLRFFCIACFACTVVSSFRSDNAVRAALAQEEANDEVEAGFTSEPCECVDCISLGSVSVEEARQWGASPPKVFFKYWRQKFMENTTQFNQDWDAKYQDCGVALGFGSGAAPILAVKKKASLPNDEYVVVKYQDETQWSKNEIAMLNKFKEQPRIIQIKDAERMESVFKSYRGTEHQAYSLIATEKADGNMNKCAQSTPQVKLLLFRSMLQGLQIMHDAGIAHRNLKPSNVVLFAEKENINADKEIDWPAVCAQGQVKLTDLGMACTTNMQKYMCRAVMGTPLYEAPELLKAQMPVASRSNDMWAAGIILHELVYGDRPQQLNQGMDAFGKKLFKEQLQLNKLKENIKNFQELDPQSVSFDWMQGDSVPVIDLLNGLLQPKPKDRFDVKAALALLATMTG